MIVFHETQTDSPDSPCVHAQDLSNFSVGVDRLDKAQHPCLISTVPAQNHLPLFMFVERTPRSGLEYDELLPLGFSAAIRGSNYLRKAIISVQLRRICSNGALLMKECYEI